jgi:hypothetical protein
MIDKIKMYILDSKSKVMIFAQISSFGSFSACQPINENFYNIEAVIIIYLH